jgi:hypothetical protein
MIKEIICIGDGGAFDNKTNSSFLLKFTDKK